jgi:hypothetical protein
MAVFFWRGTGGSWFLPTIASASAGPTTTEVTSGTPLTACITGVSGFSTKLNRVGFPVLSTSVEEQTDGPQTPEDCGLTLIEDNGTGSDATALARRAAVTALVDGAAGYIVMSRTKQTLVAADKVYVYPVKVGAANPGWSLDANVSTIQVDFALTGSVRKAVAVS